MSNLLTIIGVFLFFFVPIFFNWRKFKLALLFDITLSVILIASGVYSGYGRVPEALLFSVLFAFTLFTVIISFINIFLMWEEYDFKSLIPFCVLIIGLVSSVHAPAYGHDLRLKIFEERLPQYNEIVYKIKNKEIEPPLFWEEIPQEYSHLAMYIASNFPEDPNIEWVCCNWDRGHAFLYLEDADFTHKTNRLPDNWHLRKKINEHWYYVDRKDEDIGVDN